MKASQKERKMLELGSIFEDFISKVVSELKLEPNKRSDRRAAIVYSGYSLGIQWQRRRRRRSRSRSKKSASDPSLNVGNRRIEMKRDIIRISTISS